MRMSTTERLQTLNSFLIDNIIITEKDRKIRQHVILSFTPRIIIFQNYKPNEKVVAKFLVKNISTVSNTIFKNILQMI